MKVEPQRQSVSNSIKFSPHTTGQIEEANIPLDKARQTAMTSISQPLLLNNIIGLNLSEFNELVVYNQLDAVMRGLQAASIAAARSSALSVSAVQQTSTSVSPLTSEHQHTHFATGIGSLQIMILESEINAMQSDVGGKFGDAAAPNMTESQPDLKQALEVRTARASRQAAELKESASKYTRVRKLKKISKKRLPNKRLPISSTEAEASGSTIPEPVQSLEGVEIEPDDLSHSKSQSNTTLCRRRSKAAQTKVKQVVIESDDKSVSKESTEQMCFKPHQTCWSTEKATVKIQILANVWWSLLVLLLSVSACCLAFAKGGDLKNHCTQLDCYFSAIKSAVQLQGRDSDSKPEKIPKEESWNFALSDQNNDIHSRTGAPKQSFAQPEAEHAKPIHPYEYVSASAGGSSQVCGAKHNSFSTIRNLGNASN